MKKAFIFLLIASILLTAGCNKPSIARETTVSTTPSSIAATTSIKVEDCPQQFLRSNTRADGSKEYYCLDPAYFNLKQCSSQADCKDFEACTQGYCQILYED